MGMGLFGPSMGLPPPALALRGQPAAVLVAPGKFVEPVGSSTPLSPPDTKTPH